VPKRAPARQRKRPDRQAAAIRLLLKRDTEQLASSGDPFVVRIAIHSKISG